MPIINPRLTPPDKNLFGWCVKLYNWLLQQQLQQDAPQPVKLARLTPTDRATQDGILMWDADTSSVVVSYDGAWEAIWTAP